MSGKATILKGKILDALEEGVGEILKILNSPTSPPMTKINAFNTLADRCGLPAVRANYNSNLNATTEIGELGKAREELLAEQRKITQQLRELKGPENGRVRPERVDRQHQAFDPLPQPTPEEDLS